MAIFAIIKQDDKKAICLKKTNGDKSSGKQAYYISLEFCMQQMIIYFFIYVQSVFRIKLYDSYREKTQSEKFNVHLHCICEFCARNWGIPQRIYSLRFDAFFLEYFLAFLPSTSFRITFTSFLHFIPIPAFKAMGFIAKWSKDLMAF